VLAGLDMAEVHNSDNPHHWELAVAGKPTQPSSARMVITKTYRGPENDKWNRRPLPVTKPTITQKDSILEERDCKPAY
jgi:hypothetical protein